MDSQETASNAAESPSDRELSAVKSNPPLPSVYRARPQGPPGLPRHPVNNGPVAQPRPSGQQHQQIRFDTRQASPVQFGQVRPYGPPRPPAGSFPQKSPQQQGQHPPIVLNPRFPSPSVQRSQLGPRPPHPGPYPAPKFQGNVQRPQHPRPEYPNGPYQPRPDHPNVPQQGRNPDVLVQKRLQRDESLLSIPQQSLPIKREDKPLSAPRIVVEKMADVDSSRKPRQLESPASKERTEQRENAENDDDDDDVVMDGKSPRANGNVGKGDLIEESKLSESDVQSARRPENAATHGKIGTIAEKIGQKISSEEKPVKDSNVKERDNRLSAKSNEEERDKLLDKREVDKIGDQLDEPERKLVEDQAQKENANKEKVTKPTTHTETNPSSVVEDIVAKLNNSNAEQSTKKSEETKSGRSEEEPGVALIAKSNEGDRKVQAPAKSPDRSPRTDLKSSTLPDKSRAEAEFGQEGVSKSPEQLRGSSPANTGKEQSDRELKTPCSVSQSNSPASTPVKVNQTREKHDLVSAPETKLDVDLLKETREAKNALQEPKESNTPMEMDQKKSEQEPAEPLKLEKSSEKERSSDLSHSPREKELNDPSSKPPNKSASVTEKSSAESVLENFKSDDPRDTLETCVASVASSPPASQREEASETQKSSPNAADDSVKGFDNGEQRSLSIKSSSPRDPRSPVSPKSPVEDEKLEENERKADDKTTSDSKSLPKPAKSPKVQRAPTPAKRNEKSEKKSPKTPEVENGSVTNESVQSNAEPTTNGVGDSPTKKSPSKSKEADKRSTAGSPIKSPSKSVKSLPRTPETPSSTAGQEKKKLPMNKIQVGAAPSPNLKTVRSKIGSLENASYKPGGGKVKIENRKLDFSKAQPKIAAKNEKYTPSGGDKKIAQMKLQWNAKPKVGSLENATYKPGGGDKKIETVKLDFKDKAKPKVGSKDNAKHIPGGGGVKSSATPPKTPQDPSNDIQTQKIDIKAESKIGSLDNVKHKPGGGDKKIFNDKDYLRQTGTNPESLCGSGSQENLAEETNSSGEQAKDDFPQPPPSTPTKARNLRSPSMVTPKAVRSSLAKSPETVGLKRSSPPLQTTETENRNKKNPSSENENVIKGKTAKSPINSSNTESKNLGNRTAKSPVSPPVPNNDQLESPEDKTTKSPISSRPPSSRLKNLEEKVAKSPTSSRPPSSISRSSEERAIKSPNSPRSPNSLRIKSPDKSSSHMSGKSSPKELRLPKLAPSPTSHETTTLSEVSTKISLPKLTERVTH
ncbi:microtubule-associated protein tau isoform X1 [Frieseomelitta varia]|uniref:microtubule-associated protein tau isoform X1 n=1 Tax=Frieseomelitta varia TaxID=561572 RepID=UPI001CB68D4B|nr:microtubule-associated protein tau isoform X1 [Frieseomelitta varia]